VKLPALDNDQWGDGFSVKMFLHGIFLSGDSQSHMLGDCGFRNQVARSYWRGDRHETHAPDPQTWQIEWLRRKFGSLECFAEQLRNRPQERMSPPSELIKKFRLNDLRRFFEGGVLSKQRVHDEIPLAVPSEEDIGLRKQLPTSLRRLFAMGLPWIKSLPDEPQLTKITRTISIARPAGKIQHPFGVNLYGYAHGELGIGEDVRLVAEALDSNCIPCAIIDIKLGKHVSQLDKSADRFVTSTPHYGINLFCQTGIEMARFVNTEGVDFFQGRYTIGLWPWELPEWPESCRHAYGLVDEIWGISAYSASAYGSFPGIVTPLTLPVTVSNSSALTRKHFGLSEDCFTYLFSFDLHSRMARKNPLGVINAFQKAFPRNDSAKVCLVVKVNHPETFSLEWKRIEWLASMDHRIHIIAKRMRRKENHDLMRCCDCYVSLHRAEGFGRGIAEAILLGKQVISTGWSGNMDYCREPRVALVRHHRIPLKKGEYFHGEGQYWVEPDLEHAAELMRQIRQYPRDITTHIPDLSPKTIGSLYAKRLRIINQHFAANR
jgi:hypothetical protein